MPIPSAARARTNSADRRAGSAASGQPLWSRWNSEICHGYTLGIEEEVMLLEPDHWSLAQSSDEVLAALSDELAPHASSETHAAVIELATGVHREVSGAVAELGALRQQLGDELRGMGLTAAAAGTHPSTIWAETQVSSSPRYRLLNDSLRVLARREPTMALHVHVGVPEPEAAVRMLNGFRRHLPLLLALSANSPFWQCRDVGFDSARTVIFQAFPRTGLPRRFESYGDYVRAVDALIASGAIPDPSFLWWDARLQPRLGTVEVRIMDAQSSLRDIAPLVALIQCLARREHRAGQTAPVPGIEVLSENRFLAARDGMDAQLIDTAWGRLTPAREMLKALVTECRPHAAELGCAAALEHVHDLMAANGAARQRDFTAGTAGLESLVEHLALGFATQERAAAEVGWPITATNAG
jgi:glutamate---cysteine ligase / carboxylate-amine ligase